MSKPTLTEQTETLVKRIATALTGQPSLEQLQAVTRAIRARRAEIDDELRTLKEPVNPGTGGREYLRALREGTPEDLQAIVRRREVLEAERQQLSARGRELRTARERAEIRDADRLPRELDQAAEAIEAAFAAYQQAVAAARRPTQALRRARQLADRHKVAGPSLSLATAETLARHESLQKGARVVFLRDLADAAGKPTVSAGAAVELMPPRVV